MPRQLLTSFGEVICRGSRDVKTDPPAPLTSSQCRLALTTHRQLLSPRELARLEEGLQPTPPARLSFIANLPQPLRFA